MAKAYLISDLHIDHYLGSDPSVESIKKFLSPHLCPADMISVAGDISNHIKSTVKTLRALSEMYSRVVWTIGNHDMVAHNGENSFDKIHRLTHATGEISNVTYMNGTVDQYSNSLIGGSMGYCDFSYSEKHFGVSKELMTHKWFTSWFDGRFWNIGDRQPLDVWADEYDKLNACVDAGCNFMVSHFGPAAVKVDSRFHNALTGFFYFDGLNLLQKMPVGSVWHFGHTHDYFIEEVGNTRVMCNPFGYPDETRNIRIPKEEFVIDV